MSDAPTNPESPIGACAVIVSSYNKSVTDPMRVGAIDAYTRLGGDPARLSVIEAPGAYELAPIAHAAAASGVYESVVCLGCVIKGETDHDVHISRAVAHALCESSSSTGVPISFGVLTTNTLEQAIARAGGGVDSGKGNGLSKGNKGAEAMGAALSAARAVRALAPGHDAGLRLGLLAQAPDKGTA